jgi:hypothetical protein
LEKGEVMKKMMRNKKILALAAVLLSAFVAIAFATTMIMWTWTKNINVVAPQSAVVYTVNQALPDGMYQDTQYEMIVTCENKAPIPYAVTAYLKVVGPSGFDNNDIFVHWVVYNITGGSVKIYDFTIGRGGTGMGAFTNHDGYWVDWTGTPDTMNPGVKYEHHVFVTIYGSGPTGTYTPYVEVTGTGM